MHQNDIIQTMLQRKSIRRYNEKMPSDEDIETVVRAGQQAPFASQLGSLLLSRRREKASLQSAAALHHLRRCPQVGADHGLPELGDVCR